MTDDDLDDILDGQQAELEARFRELEQMEELERLRQQGSGNRPPPRGAASASAAPGTGQPSEPDPLHDLKAALDEDRPVERYLLVLCPSCQTRNRMSLSKVRNQNPICGHCKEDLSFIK